MSLATIDANTAATSKDNKEASQADFDKYFSQNDIFELFDYKGVINVKNQSSTLNRSEFLACQTLDMLLNRDGFPLEETPTNLRHVAFLRTLETV